MGAGIGVKRTELKLIVSQTGGFVWSRPFTLKEQPFINAVARNIMPLSYKSAIWGLDITGQINKSFC